MRKLLLHPLCLLALAACMCASLNGGGSGTNTGNGVIAGTVVTPGNEPGPAVGAKVRLRRDDYVRAPALGLRKTARSSADQLTDKNGRFFIDSLDSGAYCIEVNDGKSNAVLFRSVLSTADTHVDLPADTLRPTGTIKGTIPAIPGIADVFVQLRGLERLAKRDTATGVFVISDVPKGMYTVRIVSLSPDSLNKEINGIAVTSGAETDIGKLDPFLLEGWRYSKAIHFNTTSSGAGVPRNVFNFPVLVRLTSSNFDFAGAGAGGRDLRFAKPDNTPLPYEIERWDAAAGLAEVWVKVDTVHGNDSSHFILVHWGNAAAVDGSKTAAVFDTAAGFAGVWHLGENGDSIHDATGDAFNGMNSGTTSAAGMIGNARNFSNGDYIKIAGLLATPANVTMSAWVSSDTLNWGQNNNWGQEIVSIGDYAGLRLDDAFGIGTSGWYQNRPIGPGPDSSFLMVNSGRFLANTGWHFIAFSINTATHVQVFYIDGVQCAIANDVNPICYLGLGTDTYIGIHGNNEKIYNFSGRIDEVRVSNISLSSDWIKLCFMNQKEQDALVRW